MQHMFCGTCTVTVKTSVPVLRVQELSQHSYGS
uniref:Uncharacterized protein n=1 Tax=Vitis vinifera TaxID=29760 RepID=F6HVM6_VITVI